MTSQETPAKIHMLSDSELDQVSITRTSMRQRVMILEEYLGISPFPKYKHSYNIEREEVG